MQVVLRFAAIEASDRYLALSVCSIMVAALLSTEEDFFTSSHHLFLYFICAHCNSEPEYFLELI